MNKSAIEKIKEKYAASLMSKEGVVGVGIEELSPGEPFIKVYVIKKSPKVIKLIPRELEGFKVVIEGVGEVKPL